MKETYSELHITPSSAYEYFADFVLTLTQDAIEECDGTIIVRCEEDLQSVDFGVKEFAKALNTALGQDITVTTTLEQKLNIDWISKYQNSIQPVQVGELYIHPSWLKPKEGKINIVIDPALAFGSGHHESTYGCLLMLQKYLKNDAKLLDVGCGSGILSIASSFLGARVDFCDTDAQAVQSAQENFKKNHQTYENSWIGSVQKAEAQYDVLVANIIADVLIMLAPQLISALREDGMMILSGILDRYIDRVEQRYGEMKIIEKYNKQEWFTLVLQRKSK